MFLGGCPCCGGVGGCWYKAMDSQCAATKPEGVWLKKPDMPNTGCPDCCWSLYEQFNYTNVNRIASLLYDQSVGAVLNNSLPGFACNSSVFAGNGFVVTKNTLVFTADVDFTDENGYYEGEFVAEAATTLGFGPAVFRVTFQEYGGASRFGDGSANPDANDSKPKIIIPFGPPAARDGHLYQAVFYENTGVITTPASVVAYDPNTGAETISFTINSRSFGGYEWGGVCQQYAVWTGGTAPYLWQNNSHLRAELIQPNDLLQVYRDLGSQTISNENWNASNQTLSESVAYVNNADGSNFIDFDFAFTWPELTSVFTRRRASHCGQPDSPIVLKALTCVPEDFCDDGNLYDTFEDALSGEYVRGCYYTDYESACVKIADKPDEMQYQKCGHMEPSDCLNCFAECPEATGYKLAKELSDNPPEDGDPFFGTVTYNKNKIDVVYDKNTSNPRYISPTELIPPNSEPAFTAHLNSATYRTVSLTAVFNTRVRDPNNTSGGGLGDLFSTTVGLSGRSVKVSCPGNFNVRSSELRVSFAGQDITDVGDQLSQFGTSACFSVPCATQDCGAFAHVQQDDFRGPIVISHTVQQEQSFGQIRDFEFNYEIELPDSFYESHCWLCPDEPKPTIPIDYTVLEDLVPVYDPRTLGGRNMTTKTTGPGTQLANLLKWFGIKAKEKGCGCKSFQKKMDKGGPQWCRDHKEEILDHLAKEAAKRKLPFVRLAAEKLVDLAIRRAERDSA